MSVDPRENFVGLVTNASSLITPPGALIEAENVVIRKPGMVEPREGMEAAPNSNGREAWAFRHNRRDIYGRYTSPTFTYFVAATGVQVTGETQPFRRDILTAAQLRGVLYLPGADGVRRLQDNALAFETSGVLNTAFLSVVSLLPGASGWLPPDSHAAYRLVVYSKDAGGMVRRSSPSGPFEVQNTSATDHADVRVQIATYQPYVGPLTVEIYRSAHFPLDITIDDEMQLVGTVELVGFPVDFYDRVKQEERGAVLYTSPSHGGILMQNDPPPACACVAAFKRSMFYANWRGPGRLTLSYELQPGIIAGATGIGTREFSVTTTSGVAVVTMASTVGLRPGQRVAGLSVGSNTILTAVTAGSVTMSPAPSATGTNTLQFIDQIWIGTDNWPADQPELIAGSYPVSMTQIVPGPYGRGKTYVFTLDNAAPVGPEYTIRATHGAEYSPPVPAYEQPAKAWEQETVPGGIRWSKPDEPEAVPPVYYAYVGDSQKAVLGLVPTRDALFVLKEDGVFRLTGVNATWRIDPYDPTLYCVLPNSVRALQERAYFLSNKGVIEFWDGGSEIVSLPVNDVIMESAAEAAGRERTSGLYELSGIVGSHAAVYDRENEYLIMDRSKVAYVFNRNTRAWTVHKHAGDRGAQLVNLFELPYAGRYCARYEETLFSTRYTLQNNTEAPAPLRRRFDISSPVTIAGSTGGATPTITLSAPLLGALVDDQIQAGGNGVAWRIVSIAGAVFTLAPITDATGAFLTPPASGTATVYRTLRCVVTPQYAATPGPRPKHWRAFSSAFRRFENVLVARLSYSSSETPRVVTPRDTEEIDYKRLTTTYLADHPGGFAYSGLVPNAHARAWQLLASISWVMARGNADLIGLYFDAETMQLGRQSTRAA